MTTILEELQAALGDAYRIQRELGGGGMSRVFVAEETALGRPVVIKALPPDLAAGLNAERFRREVQLAARLQHPHIVPLLSASRAGNLLYYTMPLVEGESLRTKLARETELPVGEAVRLLRDVVDALAYAHEQGVLHRDIKPDNVLVSRHHALVTDFGIAKALSEAAVPAGPGAPPPGTAGFTSAGIAMGTPTYMAPEQAAADPTIDHRADIYAVGVMAYEMLAGHPPFLGRSPQQVLAAHVSRPVEPLEAVRPSVPADLARVVMRCLEKRPADRWQGADELLRALDGVITPGAGTAATVPVVGVLRPAAPSRGRAWRRAAAGAGLGALALAGLALALRAAGLLPGGSLLERGVLGMRDRIIVSEFRSPPADSALGGAMTEAFRIDLAQSPSVTVVQPEYVQTALVRMQRDPRAPLDPVLAREVAIRDGIKAVVAGDIAHAGTGFVISARLIATASGDALVSLRETAEDSTRILAALDRLSRAMRKRIGESLRSVRATEPLEAVTTGSLEALRKYSLALSANREGDSERAIGLLREAVALDTAFAMAYRKLGVVLSNTGGPRSEQVDAFTRAYRHQDRLTDRERYLTQAAYATYVTGDREQAIAAYRSLLDLYPDDTYALNNLSGAYQELRNYQDAAALARRAVAVSPDEGVFWTNLFTSQVYLGQWDSAEATLRAMRNRTPRDPMALLLEAQFVGLRGDPDSAAALVRRVRDQRRESAAWRGMIGEQLAQYALIRGRLREAETHLREAGEASAAEGRVEGTLVSEAARAGLDLWFRGARARGARELDAALARHPFAEMDPMDRPYLPIALLYAEAGRPDRARGLLAEFDRTATPGARRIAASLRHAALGSIALAEGRPRDAIAEFRLQEEGGCPVCAAPSLGRAYEAAGEPDSARAAYERYLTTPYPYKALTDAIWLGWIYVRLGERYEAKHDRARAADYYRRFVDLWQDADPELRPRVAEVKRRLEALSAERAAT